MEVTHDTPNIKELETLLGEDSIEYFISKLAMDVELIDDMAQMKPWESPEISEMDKVRFQMAQIPYEEHLKNGKLLQEEQQALLN